MSIVIGTLRIDLEANTASFSEGLGKMEHLAGKTANDVKRSLEKIAAGGLLIGSALAAGTEELVRRSMEAIVGLDHMSQAAGTTIDQLSALNFAAQRVGVPTELLVKGMERLANSAFKAQNGNVALANIFARLGVHVTDSQGHLKDTGLLVDEIAPKFAGMADGAGKTALAIQLFGRGGAAMIPFLNEWGAHMDELRAKAHQFGMVIGPEVAERTIKFHEVLNELKTAWTGFGLQMTAAALPALTAFAQKLEEVAIRANIPELAKTFGANLATALTKAVDLLDFAVQHAHALKLALEGIVAVKTANLLTGIAMFGIEAAQSGKFLTGLGRGAMDVAGLENLGKVVQKMPGWLTKMEEGFAGAAAAGFGLSDAAAALGRGLLFLATNPVVLTITALTTLGVTMFELRNKTFEARGEIFKYMDAYALLAKVIITRRLPVGGIAAGLAQIRAERLAAEFPFVSGGSVDRTTSPTARNQADTSGLGIPKKDVFGEEIKKLDLATITAAKYLSVIDETPDKIQAVTSAQKAAGIILKLNNELTDSHRQKLTEDLREQINQRVAVGDSVLALEAYGKELVNQQHSTDIATQQARVLAAAHLQGDEAVRRAAVDNAILGLSYNKTALELKVMAPELAKLKALLSAKSDTDVVEGAKKSAASLEQQLRAMKILTPAAIQYTDALREAELQAATLAITERINAMEEGEAKNALIAERQATIELTKAKWAHADAQAAIALRSPLEQYKAEIDALEHQRVAIEKGQGQSLSYSQSLVLAGKAQDAFNKTTDETVNMLLKFGTIRDGVTAFFLDMQKEGKKTGAIIYEALHSAFEKLSDNLTELMTGGKTNFAKMFQDIGKQMLNQTIKSGLQQGIGALGKALGINLGGALKRDGSDENHALWVQMAGMAGLGGLSPGLTDTNTPGIGGALSKVGGFIGKLFGVGGGHPDGSTAQNALWVRLSSAVAGLGGGAGGGAMGIVGGILGKLGINIPGVNSGGPADGTQQHPFYVIDASQQGGGGGGLGGLLGALGGAGGGAGGGLTESVTSSISFAGFAEGGTPSPGSAYLVGENGPELRFASGEIASNSASERMLSQPAVNHNYTIDARGTDPVLTEQRVRTAIIAAHNSAVSNSLQVSQEHLKRSPQRR